MLLCVELDLGVTNVIGKKRKKHYYKIECPGCGKETIIVKNDALKKKYNTCQSCNAIRLMKVRSEKLASVFQDRANAIHNNKYDYSLVKYINGNVKIKIICLTHGVFEQRPKGHLLGYGCSKCVGRYIPSTEEYKLFVLDKFNIEPLDEYINGKTKILHRCSCGNTWKVTPDNVKRGHKCRKCTKLSDFNSLYIWNIPNTSTYKIGITSSRLGDTRIRQVALVHSKDFKIIIQVHTNNAKSLEYTILKKYRRKPICDFNGDGKTEFRWLSEKELSEILIYIKDKQNENN